MRLIQYFQQLDAEGRARFAALTTDTERLIQTKYTSGAASIVAAIVLSILYIPVLCAIFAYWVPPPYRDSMWWIYLIYTSIWLGAIQGSAIGSVLGWGLGLYWQGKRHKAGLLCLLGGAIGLFLLVIFQAIYYPLLEMPLPEFIYWAFLIFSPGYVAVTGMTAWGLTLICTSE